MEEDSEEHYKTLLNDIWRKGFPLVTDEERHKLPNGRPANDAELAAMHARLTEIKDALNRVKSQVHALVTSHQRGEPNVLARWRSFTSFTHPMRQLPRRFVAKCAEMGVPPPQLCTQAYCKLVQMAAAHPALLQVPGEEAMASNPNRMFRSLHLCEAPGAFVLALKHCLPPGTHWEWRMNSLNPSHCVPESLSSLELKEEDEEEVASPSRTSALSMDKSFLLANKERMAFGPDGSGDIFHWDSKYMAGLVEGCGGRFHLVTGDGGFDCTDDPEEQESRVRPLIEQQFRVATECLDKGGSLLLKAFTFFEPDSVRLLARICSAFGTVHCLKPPSSKPGNSEVFIFYSNKKIQVYLLCLNFLGIPPPNAPMSVDFLQRVEMCARFFADHQMRFIQFNLRTFRRLSQTERTKLELQKCMAQGVMAEFIWQKIGPALFEAQSQQQTEHSSGGTESKSLLMDKPFNSKKRREIAFLSS